MKHVHHIIPKHMGGTDDPSNLVSLTIEEHSEAHRVLWLNHGKKADYIAWNMLSGRVNLTEEDRIELAKEGFMNMLNDPEKKLRWRNNIKIRRNEQVISPQSNIKRSNTLRGRIFSDTHKQRISASLMGRPGTSRKWSNEERKRHSERMMGSTKGIPRGPQSEETRWKKSNAAKLQHLRRNQKIAFPMAS